MAPLYDLSEPLSFGWGIVHHLLSVKNSPALREAEAEVQPEVVASALALGQSRAFYDGFVALRASPEWPSLTPAQQRIIEASIVDAELAGVGLEGEKKQRFIAIETELAEAATTFSNNLLDATKAYALVLHDPADVAGLPQSALAAAAQSARENAGDDARLAGGHRRSGPLAGHPGGLAVHPVHGTQHAPRSARTAVPRLCHPGLQRAARQPAAAAEDPAAAQTRGRAAGVSLLRGAGPAAQDGQGGQGGARAC